MGKEEWKGRKGKGEGKRGEAPENAENRNFLPNFISLMGYCTHPILISAKFGT